MKRIVLLRHGQSIWNVEGRFTGWADVDLTNKGVEEAIRAGRLLNQHKIFFSQAFVSYLKRANKTLNVVLDQMDLDWIPVIKSWRLNGRHYGDLEGLNKIEMISKYGGSRIHEWRRGYLASPPKMDQDDERSPWRNEKYKSIDPYLLPLGESLKEACVRILPYWQNDVMESLRNTDNILVVSHSNALRGIIKYIKNIPDDEISKLSIPTATPYVFEYDEKLRFRTDYFL